MLVVTFPYWPLIAAGIGPDVPAAVVEANRVTFLSPAAAYEGIALGMRRREAEGRCPTLVLVPSDSTRDAREFERVMMALEAVTPTIEIINPGTCMFVMESCVRFFGGEQVVTGLAHAAVAKAAGNAGFGMGVADGLFAAGLAGLQSFRTAEPVVVPPGSTRDFLSPQHISVLRRPDLCDLLVRLGIKTLGSFAALPAADVAARFGPDGLAAHRLSCGLDEHLFQPRVLRPVLETGEVLEAPTDRIDVAIFIGKGLADRLATRLDEEGLICEKLLIQASFDNGDELSRSWRLGGASSSGAIAERVRWQLEGWMAGANAGRSGSPPGLYKDAARRRRSNSWGDAGAPASLVALRLVPEDVSADRGHQLSFWAGAGQGGLMEQGKRAVRGVARLQGLLGPQAVLVPQLKGGRGPGDQFRLICADGVDLLNRAPNPPATRAPWPGTIPAPSPAVVYHDRSPVRLVGALDQPLEVVNQRLSGEATRLLVKGDKWVSVTGWAGPWPVNERWWDQEATRSVVRSKPTASRKLSRLQVVCSDENAYLIAYEQGQWWLEGRYD